ncbi:sigma-54-dependent transcriptional regulator [Chitinophaga rhizophila]|uniref:Sigma-54 dependent transcriptional regulator n=1 Tax=Chitinophaga rhizophila TaxID=2866212 RepID=A0ABS7GI13_9BACT|nr:sigma-54 dependent transcriptional regulator [Chitinophaga rhizophila]MBW8687318.1 sigma-54 dependent transcriptional regulator [Chitinophaga rhizophila]
MQSILVIDDEINICTLLSTILGKEGYHVEYSLSGANALKMMKERSFDLVFCDYRLKDKEIDGSMIARKVSEEHPSTSVIIMTGYPDVRIAIQLIKSGISDYVSKPFNAGQLVLLAKKTLMRQQTAAASTPSLPSNFPPAAPAPHPVVKKAPVNTFIYGDSRASKDLHEQIRLIASTDYSVIIMGETGTGKESVAHLIHSQSKRKDKPFIAIDCGCLSRELGSSELFGHEKGAFTGAIAAKTGAFVEANGGTLFLDEIGNLTHDVQTTLLRAIQERLVRAVGSTQEIRVDIRIIVASNEDLQQNVLTGKFREDLYYRLNEFTVNVPPLRERQEDMPLFTQLFKQMVEQELSKTCGDFQEELLEALYRYPWPGNIRELKNVIRRLCLLAGSGEIISCRHLPEEMQEKALAPVAVQEAPFDHNVNLKEASRLAEYNKIISVLQKVRYNKSAAARAMNIDRKTLYNKLQSLNILL